MSRQAALLLALGAAAAASALISFGSWILLRRGRPAPGDRHDGDEGRAGADREPGAT